MEASRNRNSAVQMGGDVSGRLRPVRDSFYTSGAATRYRHLVESGEWRGAPYRIRSTDSPATAL